MITGNDLQYWCDDHLAVMRKQALKYLGQPTYDIIFRESVTIDMFWVSDIRTALDRALGSFFSAIAHDLLGSNKDMPETHSDAILNANIVIVKAKEYEGVITLAEVDNQMLSKVVSRWAQAPYINDIGGPLGDDTRQIFYRLGKSMHLFYDRNMGHMICMALAAKRCQSYKHHEYSRELTQIERSIWELHNNQLNMR